MTRRSGGKWLHPDNRESSRQADEMHLLVSLPYAADCSSIDALQKWTTFIGKQTDLMYMRRTSWRARDFSYEIKMRLSESTFAGNAAGLGNCKRACLRLAIPRYFAKNPAHALLSLYMGTPDDDANFVETVVVWGNQKFVVTYGGGFVGSSDRGDDVLVDFGCCGSSAPTPTFLPSSGAASPFRRPTLVVRPISVFKPFFPQRQLVISLSSFRDRVIFGTLLDELREQFAGYRFASQGGGRVSLPGSVTGREGQAEARHRCSSDGHASSASSDVLTLPPFASTTISIRNHTDKH
ncbi:hypothetical protein EV421DRAFT_1744192 [Armillaria borealis]|uniref:Uncharacterized protein n=1 Tax=Armillaria borealis TaxID=47425 RepID=A0AA39IV55_9AGAR|nr:hypothetical protein EV421DRAFT_1744192 [Armillaria borealis]